MVAARAAFTWRRVDEELALAGLVYDSVADAALAGRVRAAGQDARTLAFRGAGRSVELEVTPDGVVGQVHPAAGDRITGEAASGAFGAAEVDEAGCFILADIPAGPVRLRFSAGTRGLVTDWVVLR